MIGNIQGKILEKEAPLVVIETHGLGYEIDVPMSTFSQLPDLNQTVNLFTHFIVREDAHHLYGFYTREERQLFRILLKVNGVGPRLALAILSSVTPHQFVACVLDNDMTRLIKLPGVGKKTAERLVIEMRDKLSDWSYGLRDEHDDHTNGQVKSRRPIIQDAISALVALGYKQQEANRCVTKIDDGSASSEELIRRALKEIST